MVVGEVTLGGTIKPVRNAVTLVEQAVEKGAKSLVVPATCRRQLLELSHEMATKLGIEFYQDGRDSLPKALANSRASTHVVNYEVIAGRSTF